MKTPEEQYKELKLYVLKETSDINDNTAWQEGEPEWWLEMVKLRRFIYDLNKGEKNASPC